MWASTILELARDAAVDLFAGYGVVLTPTEEQPEPLTTVCGVIGFVGDGIQGCLLLAVTDDVLRASYPLEGPPSDDWPGELVNQHVGRLKSALLDRGVTIFLSTPLVLRGVGVVPVAGARLGHVSFRAGADRASTVRMWLDTRLAPEFALADPTPGAGLAEGQSLMFLTPFPE